MRVCSLSTASPVSRAVAYRIVFPSVYLWLGWASLFGCADFVLKGTNAAERVAWEYSPAACLLLEEIQSSTSIIYCVFCLNFHYCLPLSTYYLFHRLLSID